MSQKKSRQFRKATYESATRMMHAEVTKRLNAAESVIETLLKKRLLYRIALASVSIVAIIFIVRNYV